MIRPVKWTFTSGKLPNRGRPLFLKLVANIIRYFNKTRDADGVSYMSKYMIRCGAGGNFTDNWYVYQLVLKIQDIVTKHVGFFNGNERQ